MIGGDLTHAVRLEPHVFAAGQRDGVRVAESADPAQSAEIVIEGAILLHDDHHVLDILYGSGLHGSGDGEGAANRRGKHRGRRGSPQEAGRLTQELSSVEIRHSSHSTYGLHRQYDLSANGAQEPHVRRVDRIRFRYVLADEYAGERRVLRKDRQ